MSIFDSFLGLFRFRPAAKIEAKPTKENHGSSWNSPNGVRNPFNALTALEAYGNHGYLYAAISRACEDLAALPIKVMKGKGKNAQQVDDHDLVDLLDQPSLGVVGFLFRNQITLDLILSGSCYVLILGVNENKPDSIVRLHPDEVRIVTNDLGIVGYEHTSNGQSVLYPPERILTARNASYAKGAKSLYGTGAIESLRRELNADINTQNLTSQASAQGHPDILISPKDGDIWPAETRRQISDNYSKLAKSGGVMVLSGEADVTPLNVSPKDMEFETVRTMTMQIISAVIGTPPSVLGMPSANYATSRQQAINYFSMQKKRAKRIDIMLNNLARRYGKDLYVQHDFAGVEPLQEVRSAQLERIQIHIMNGMDPAAAYAFEGLEDAPFLKDDEDKAAPVLDEKAEKTVLRLFEAGQKKNFDDAKKRRAAWGEFYTRRYQPTEKRARLIFSKYLREAKRRYISRAEQYIEESVEKRYSLKAASFVSVVDWSSLKGEDIEVRKIREMTKSFYKKGYDSIGQEELTKIMNEAGQDVISFRSGDALDRHLKKVSREITKTTVKKIQDAVKKGEEQGLSKDEIIRSIKRSVAFNDARAQTIARTESTKIINSALNESYKQAEENGVMLRKMWITENDDSVRETHQELDGVTVKAGEDFVTSGGDASPSPANFGIESEDVNCRCTMEAIVAKE